MNFSTEIIERRRKRYERERRTTRQDHPRASGVGECAREIYHQITDWNMKPRHEAPLLQRFQRGKDVENIVIRELIADGWEVTESQLALEIKEDYKGKPLVICTGHIDFDLLDPGSDEAVVVDCKSLHPSVFDRINDAKQFLEMDSFWRKYAYQVPLYMYAKSRQHGMYLIDDCLGHWKCLPLDLDDWLDPCEDALRRCREAKIATIEGEPPGYCKNPKACRECWCRTVGICHPPLYEPNPIKDLGESGISEILDVVESLTDDGKRYERLVKDVKETVKALGPGRFVCGHWAIVCEKKSNGVFVTWKAIKQEVGT